MKVKEILELLMRRKSQLIAAAVLLLLTIPICAAAARKPYISSLQAEANRSSAEETESAGISDEETAETPAALRTGLSWEQTDAGWICRTADGEQIFGDWVEYNGQYYYINAAGIMEQDEFRLIDSYRYHFGSSGALDIGRFYVGSVEYFSDQNGVLYQDTWVPEGELWCYCDELGRILKDCMTPDSYYVGADGYMAASEGSRYEGFSYQNITKRELYLNLGTADLIWNYLKQKGWNSAAIAGVLGNFQQESGLSPTLEEEGNHVGYGLGQWSYERRTRLENYAKEQGKPVSDLYLQLDFLCSEPGEKNFVAKYSKTNWSDPASAAIEWGTHWERYRLSDHSMSRVRIPYAEAYYAHYVNGVKFLVSSTHFDEPDVIQELASDADAQVNLNAEERAEDEAATAEQGASASGDTESTSEEIASSDDSGSLAQEEKRVEGSALVTKVKRVTVFETEAAGPGVETAEASSEESGETAETTESGETAETTESGDAAVTTESEETAETAQSEEITETAESADAAETAADSGSSGEESASQTAETTSETAEESAETDSVAESSSSEGSTS